MPRRRYSKKRSRKGGRKLKLYSSPTPTRMFTKLRYSDQVQRTFGIAGKVDDYIFNATGLYDPNDTGVGHQPRGFDQWMTMYDHYTVLGAKITATFTNASTSESGVPITCAIILSDDNVGINDYNDQQEQGRVRSRTIAHPEGSRACATLTKGFGAKKFFTKSNVLDADELKGSALSNPSENAYFHLVSSIPVLTTLARDVFIDLVIDYIVAFTEPKQPVLS